MSATSPWEVLGLEATQDPRAIRRAYAALVRQARPDTDPEGFQRLTDAFEWALHDARNRQAELERQSAAPAAAAAEAEDAPGPQVPTPELGRPVEDGPPARAEPESTESVFAFGPFFEQLAEQVRKPNPLHLREWLEQHPDLYSLELKWALTPHVFDALAHNAAALDPHRGHLEALMAFFGVDARLRRHPALARALDYLEVAPWRQQEPEAAATARPATAMPSGWENLGKVIDDHERRAGPRSRRQREGSGYPVVLIVFVIIIALRILGSLAG